LTTLASANIIHVPQDSPTIQQALDMLTSGDTVLVDSGVYAEALIAPPLAFVLQGNCVADTNEFAGPWIDPTTLPGSDSLTSLFLPEGAQATLDRMGFRNGAAMYPPGGHIRPVGGIRLSSSLPLTIRHCVFDSVYEAVTGLNFPGDVYVDSSRFTNCYLTGVFCGNGGTLHVQDCRFRMTVLSECSQVNGRTGSVVSRCQFEGQTSQPAVFMTGIGIEVRDCIFRNFGPPHNPWAANEAIQVESQSSGVIENNLVTDCEFSADAIMVGCNLDSLIIRHNRIERCTGVDLSALAGIEAVCAWPPEDSALVIIEDNVISDGYSTHAVKSIMLFEPALVRRNHILRNDPDTTGAVGTGWDGLVMHDNVLTDNVIGIDQTYFLGPQHTLHAEWNYWGDSTGPYNMAENPEGLGDEVRGQIVFFNPWHPDTSFLWSPRPRAPLPQSVSLEIFPNPFNATATLKLYVTEPGIFKIDLFNLLGQHVRTIWSGAVAYEKQITFDGGALTSGIYFVRVWQPIENRPAALQKVVIAK
jgi:hypothetical protein